MTGIPPSPESMIVERLGPKHNRAVYPLIRLADPSISLSQWLRYAGGLPGHHRARRGVLTARRPPNLHPAGAVCYRSERHIDACVLVAENFVALDMLYPEALMAALLLGLDGVAAALGCQSIRAVVAGNGSPLLSALRKAGHSPEGVTMTRTLTWHTASH